MRVTRSRIRILLAACLGTIALSAAGAPAASAGQACDSAQAMPDTVSERTLANASLCLLNEQRTRRDMRRLRMNGRLSDAARRHAQDMVRRSYFSHDSPSGVDFLDRIRRTGYFSSANSWMAGENLAWGSGYMASPAAIVRSWMHSPGHRANILNRRFREIGIGVALGAPESVDDPAATYATEFGTRR
jgi:uncharacterized protein YkwD